MGRARSLRGAGDDRAGGGCDPVDPDGGRGQDDEHGECQGKGGGAE